MTRILLASYHFPPTTEIGGRRPGSLARILPTHGFEVDVVCASLDHAVGRADPSQEPVTEAKVTRVPTPFLLGRNPEDRPDGGPWHEQVVWRLKAYAEAILFTADWAWRWGVAARQAVEPAARSGRYDAIVVDAPPFPAAVPFLRLASEVGIPSVLDARDLWGVAKPSGPEPGLGLLPSTRRLRWRRALWAELMERAARVVLTSPTHAIEMSQEDFPEHAHKFVTITNGYDPTSVDSDDRIQAAGRLGEPDTVHLVYTGSLAYLRDRLVIEMLSGMRRFHDAGRRRIRLTLVGCSPHHQRAVEAAAREHGLEPWLHVDGWLPRGEVVELQRRADALLLLQPGHHPAVRFAIPAKLLEYMARRKQVLGIVDPGGSAAKIIEDHDLGVVLGDTAPATVAARLGELADRVARNRVLPHPPQEFSTRETVARFAQVLKTVVAEHA